MSTEVEVLRQRGWWAISFSVGIPGAPCKWFMTRGSVGHAEQVWGEAKDFQDAVDQMMQVQPKDATSQIRRHGKPIPKWRPKEKP